MSTCVVLASGPTASWKVESYLKKLKHHMVQMRRNVDDTDGLPLVFDCQNREVMEQRLISSAINQSNNSDQLIHSEENDMQGRNMT